MLSPARRCPQCHFPTTGKMQHPPVPLSQYETGASKALCYLSCQVRLSSFSPQSGHWDGRKLEDGRTAPERLSSATGGVPFARLGQQTGSSRQGCSRSGRASKRIEGRFHGEARELLTSCVRCEDRSADATQRLSPPALLIFGSSFPTVKHNVQEKEGTKRLSNAHVQFNGALQLNKNINWELWYIYIYIHTHYYSYILFIYICKSSRILFEIHIYIYDILFIYIHIGAYILLFIYIIHIYIWSLELLVCISRSMSI